MELDMIHEVYIYIYTHTHFCGLNEANFCIFHLFFLREKLGNLFQNLSSIFGSNQIHQIFQFGRLSCPKLVVTLYMFVSFGSFLSTKV